MVVIVVMYRLFVVYSPCILPEAFLLMGSLCQLVVVLMVKVAIVVAVFSSTSLTEGLLLYLHTRKEDTLPRSHQIMGACTTTNIAEIACSRPFFALGWAFQG